jgi:hypothetical protein
MIRSQLFDRGLMELYKNSCFILAGSLNLLQLFDSLG